MKKSSKKGTRRSLSRARKFTRAEFEKLGLFELARQLIERSPRSTIGKNVPPPRPGEPPENLEVMEVIWGLDGEVVQTILPTSCSHPNYPSSARRSR